VLGPSEKDLLESEGEEPLRTRSDHLKKGRKKGKGSDHVFRGKKKKRGFLRHPLSQKKKETLPEREKKEEPQKRKKKKKVSSTPLNHEF